MLFALADFSSLRTFCSWARFIASSSATSFCTSAIFLVSKKVQGGSEHNLMVVAHTRLRAPDALKAEKARCACGGTARRDTPLCFLPSRHSCYPCGHHVIF